MSVSKSLAAVGITAGLLAALGCSDTAVGLDAMVFDGRVDNPIGPVLDAGPDGAPYDPCDLLCSTPVGSTNTVCGQLRDFETSDRLTVDQPTGTDCQEIPAEERTGPCLLDLQAYDALALFQNPDGAAPQAATAITVNDCGRFAMVNVQTPSLGFLALVVDATEANPGDWAKTALAFPVAPGDRRDDQAVFAVRASTDAAWTASAGDPFGGETFSEHGVFAPIFLDGGVPIAGVQITDSGGPHPDDDYYFSDSDPWTRATIDPAQNATGIDGTGLLVNAGLVDHGGQGGLPDECQWPEDLAKSVPGLVLISIREAEVSATGDPCSSL